MRIEYKGEKYHIPNKPPKNIFAASKSHEEEGTEAALLEFSHAIFGERQTTAFLINDESDTVIQNYANTIMKRWGFQV